MIDSSRTDGYNDIYTVSQQFGWTDTYLITKVDDDTELPMEFAVIYATIMAEISSSRKSSSKKIKVVNNKNTNPLWISVLTSFLPFFLSSNIDSNFQ